VSFHGFGPNANQYTVELTGVTNDQTFEVTLNGVHDSDGANLTGVRGTMGVLKGNVSASRTVTSGDVTLCKAQNLKAITGPPTGPAPGNFRNDVNADGAITSGDVTIIKQNNLKSLDN